MSSCEANRLPPLRRAFESWNQCVAVTTHEPRFERPFESGTGLFALSVPSSPARVGRCSTVGPMARGWESKSVESQQDDAQSRQRVRRDLSADERARLQRRTTLELAVANTQAELQAACRPAHRDMLRLKLEALKAELGTP
jgi:hypothetical protein